MPISDAVVEALSIYIRAAFRDAKEMGFTEKIRDSMQMEDAHMVNSNRVEASLFVKLKDAPEARAYELGSGIHGQFGVKYQIAAKNVANLKFWWEREKKIFFGPKLGEPPEKGHPGVAPRPAMRNAMRNNLPFLRQKIREMVKQQITYTIRNNFEQVWRGKI